MDREESFEFNNTGVISESKPVEWLGPKSDWCEQGRRGWGVWKDVDDFWDAWLRKDFFFRRFFFLEDFFFKSIVNTDRKQL